MAGKGLGLDIEVKGEEKAAADLAALGVRAGDIRPLSYKVRTIFRKAEQERFDYSGPGWPPLADSTRERKARQGLDPRAMRAKETLYRSLTSPRASFQVDRRDRTEFEFGTTVPYAHFHETGRGVPARPLIDLTPRQQHDINDAIAAFIARNQRH
jgi:phage gpG-like protein